MSFDHLSFDAQPHLHGSTLSLRPMVEADLEDLWKVSSDPLVWALHPDPSRAERAGFERFFANGLASGGALVVTDNAGEIIGSSRYYEWDPRLREVAIGFTFLARKYWGGRANREMKQLMLDHAFKWADTVWFHVASSNLRSRRAMEKIGGRLVREGQRPFNGTMIDYAWYSMGKP